MYDTPAMYQVQMKKLIEQLKQLQEEKAEYGYDDTAVADKYWRSSLYGSTSERTREEYKFDITGYGSVVSEDEYTNFINAFKRTYGINTDSTSAIDIFKDIVDVDDKLATVLNNTFGENGTIYTTTSIDEYEKLNALLDALKLYFNAGLYTNDELKELGIRLALSSNQRYEEFGGEWTDAISAKEAVRDQELYKAVNKVLGTSYSSNSEMYSAYGDYNKFYDTFTKLNDTEKQYAGYGNTNLSIVVENINANDADEFLDSLRNISRSAIQKTAYSMGLYSN